MYHLHKDWNKIVLDKLTHPIQYQGQRVGLNYNSGKQNKWYITCTYIC